MWGLNALNFGLKVVESSVSSARYAPAISSSKSYMTEGGKEFMQEVNETKKKDSDAPSGRCSLM